MKILMMVLMVMVSGCGGDGSPVNVPPVSHCSDFTEVREVVELTQTTYQLLTNTCNSIARVIFSTGGRMTEVRKVINTHWGEDEIVAVDYTLNGFSYRDNTVGRYQNTGTQAIDYTYTNGDNFVTLTYQPSYYVKYIYEGEEGFNIILNDALYDIIILQAEEAIPTL